MEGRLRHITHDNPEFAYLMWWQDQQFRAQPGGHHNEGVKSPNFKASSTAQARIPWGFVWGIEYDVACSGSWRRFMADACILDPRMSHADLLGALRLKLSKQLFDDNYHLCIGIHL